MHGGERNVLWNEAPQTEKGNQESCSQKEKIVEISEGFQKSQIVKSIFQGSHIFYLTSERIFVIRSL
jgi:hypothetical protein